jgi:hypothetical protein
MFQEMDLVSGGRLHFDRHYFAGPLVLSGKYLAELSSADLFYNGILMCNQHAHVQ